MYGRTDSNYTLPLYLRSLFSLTTANPLETASLDKILHVFAASMRMLQMLSLILKIHLFNVLLLFLNKLLLEIRTFSNVLKIFNSSDIWDREPFYCRLLDMEFHYIKSSYDMFHICTVCHQMI